MHRRDLDGPRSGALYERALQCLPGGSSRSTLFVPPHPPYASRGEGCRLFDVDGHELIDLQNNYTTLIHGHGNAEVLSGARAALEQGSSFGLPTEAEVEMAETLRARVGWTERWRFANSGTEAVMLALRVARAATGRDGVLRFDGAYHGTYDGALVPGAAGVPKAMAADIVSVPFADSGATLAALDAHGDRIACVLVDAMPNRAGLRPAPQDFVELLRTETRRRGILLVADEVLCFRLAHGGLHSRYGIEPDLLVLGKMIGGGLPVGAVGGRAELMGLLDPRRSDALPHGGTFSANPATLGAGLAALRLYHRVEVDRLNELGEQLRRKLALQGWALSGMGSLMRFHFEDPVSLWWRAYEEGILIGANGLACLSTPMDQALLDEVTRRFARCVE
jgi:glutamate-1-semialdehyde 2,1-aminomutase